MDVFSNKTVYVWTSYKDASNWVDASSYSAFLSFRSYNLATPIFWPEDAPAEAVLVSKRLTCEVVPNPTGAEPLTLLTKICLPTLNGTAWFSAFAVVLGLSKSTIVVSIVSSE